MNDPRDTNLYDCVQRNKQTCREYLAGLDKAVTANAPVDTDADLSDNFSIVSRLSQQSLVEFFGKEAQCSLDEYEKLHASDHQSVTSLVLLLESDSEDSHKVDGSDQSILVLYY